MSLSPKAEYMWGYFIWSGINNKLEDAIKYKDKDQIEMFEELVNHYNETILLTGKHLKDKLEELRNI